MICQAILVTSLMFLATERFSKTFAVPTCLDRCGDVTIPFPFGISSDCSLDDSFLISCDVSYNPPKPFLKSGLVVLNISLDGLMKVESSVASDCYDDSGSQIKSTTSEVTSSKFLISSRLNKFTAIGCDTYALVQGSTEWKQRSDSCVSWCDRIDRVGNGTCSGIGCCQTSIPEGVRDFSVELHSFKNHTLVNSFNPCGFAFVVETESFNFSSSDLKDFQNRKFVPVVLDWSVGTLTCSEARLNAALFACHANSDCIDSSNGAGYLCKCATGFQGNPYSSDGCQDINECELEPCEGNCTNLHGSYSCSCPLGYEGDGKKGGEGCHSKNRHSKKEYSGSAFFYIASGLMIPAFGSSWILWRRKQKKVDKLRLDLFYRNGGHFIEGTFQIFRAEDLKRATNNYDENNAVSGSVERYGGVAYRAVLLNGSQATVVKYGAVEECYVEAFIKNIITFSKLHHVNIVQLLGCCLETQVPLLVFEHFEHKTVYDYIHYNVLPWDIRLKIALETARALQYMHHFSMIQVIHGHLSSSSITLDDDGLYTVKMHCINFKSYQDAYLLNPYSDPQYFLTNELNSKSDVYSLGLIVAEMLTGQKVISRDRAQGEQYLLQYFLNGSDNLDLILDSQLESDDWIDKLTQVAALAKTCLSFSPMDRPTIFEVVNELTAISDPQITIPKMDGETIRGVVRRNASFWRRRVFESSIDICFGVVNYLLQALHHLPPTPIPGAASPACTHRSGNRSSPTPRLITLLITWQCRSSSVRRNFVGVFTDRFVSLNSVLISEYRKTKSRLDFFRS